MTRALIIQLARLGDLLQTLPAIAALRTHDDDATLDVLCPSHLAPLAALFPGIQAVLPWDGAAWRRLAERAAGQLLPDQMREAEQAVASLASDPYDRVYVLNQHQRALLAGSLLGRDVRGPRLHGPLDDRLAPWAQYLRDVAARRIGRRVHLADAFCGLCGVLPPGYAPKIPVSMENLPADLASVGKRAGPWIGLIVGAGEAERLVPIEVWTEWIAHCLRELPQSRVVLCGQERDRAHLIQEALPTSLLSRIWDATGRTDLVQLTMLLSRCRWVIGTDTGPLHLAAAVGTPTMGWYFARARVHETGPYGHGHLVWQAEGPRTARPGTWPIAESVTVLAGGTAAPCPDWSLWTSQCDRWGAYYTEAGQDPAPPQTREALWRELEPAVS
jgi:ADP-heptose:LPS heptosyltransferase